jgi:hypothetical protein
MKRIIVLSTLLLSLSGLTKAQDMIFTLNYNFGYATGDLETFAPDPAYRGGGLQFTRFLESNENIGIGLYIDWQGWYKKHPRSTFAYYGDDASVSNSDMNAVKFAYLYVTPVMASFNYYFVKESSVLPFIGINVGAVYTEQELNISAISNRVNTAWDFAVGGEAGLHLVFGQSGVGANITGKYTHAFYKNTFENVQLTTDGGSFVTLGVGLSLLMLR